MLSLAGAAQAADPIMPLSEVQPGMVCTARSVIHGTAISSFDAEVLDVIADDPAAGGARLLVRVSGPAIDATGVGPGFSGSPILCDGRYAGAISESIGDYGNKVVLATPIEAILGARPTAAASARRAPALLRAARPLTAPLTVSGLSPRTRRLLARAAAKVDRTVLAAPPGPLAGYPVQDPVPGAAVAASLSTGDISVGAVGTVAYRDGDQVFAFGHPLDALGRRSLFMQDAYVFGVINNPIGVPDLGASTYKLTSSGGHPIGAITNDTFSAIAGSVGGGPASIPLRVTARLHGSSERETLESLLADERKLNLGAGLGLIAPLAASTALDRLLGSFEPVALTACVRFRVRELRKPIGFCNPYFDQFRPLDDILQGASLVDAFDLPAPRIEHAVVRIRARRGVKSDVLIAARLPRRVVAGKLARLRLTVQRRNGGRRTLTVPWRAPRRPGSFPVVLQGTGGSGSAESAFLIEFAEEFSEFFEGPSEPRTVRELARRVAGLHQDMGITARIRRGKERLIYRSDAISFEGRLRLTVRVARARR